MVLLACVAISTSSCKKDAASNKLTDNTWLQTAAVVEPALPSLGSDLWVLYAPCEKDNLTTFDSNGTGKEDEGATKCSTSDPQTASTFTWSLSSDGDELTVTTSDSLTQTLKVDELSDEVLKLSFTELDSVDNVTYKYTSTYQAQ